MEEAMKKNGIENAIVLVIFKKTQSFSWPLHVILFFPQTSCNFNKCEFGSENRDSECLGFSRACPKWPRVIVWAPGHLFLRFKSPKLKFVEYSCSN